MEVSTVDQDHAPSTIGVESGDTVAVPSMVWHNFKNVGETPGRSTAVHSPAVMEDFMREIGQRIEDPHRPPKPSGPPSVEEMHRMMEILQKYMEVLPPDRVPNRQNRPPT